MSLTSDERIRGRLERSQAVANNEDGKAKATKALCLDAGNRDQGTDSVEAEAPNEDGAVAIVSQDPGGVADGRQRIGTERR